MTGHRPEGRGSGYGALERPESAANGAHVAAMSEEPSRSRGRLMVVGSALVSSLVAVAVLALATSPTRAGKRNILPDAFPAAPNILLSSPARDTALLQGSGLSPAVNPFPNIKYNVFDPKEFPEPPHHRWSTEKLREEARRLALLANEAKSWEDKKYKQEVGELTTNFDQHAWIDVDLSNISGIESQARKHMRAIYQGLRIATRGITAAADTTGVLQASIEHGEDRTVRKIWELIYEFGKDFDFQKLIQDYIDRQARRDMAADGKMDYLKVNRYNREVEEQKERIHGWIEGLRGRIVKNFTNIEHHSEKLQRLYAKLIKDDDVRFLESFVKAQKMSGKVGEAVKKGANVEVRVRHIDKDVQEFQSAFATVTGNAQKVSDGVDALDKTIADQHLKDVEDMLPLTEKFDHLKSTLSMLITSLTTVEGVMREVQEKHSALKKEEDDEMDRLSQSVENLKPQLQSILDLDGVIKSLHVASQSKIDAASTQFDTVKAAEDKVDVDDAALQEQIELLNHTTTEQEKFVHANGYMSSYADIEHVLAPAGLQLDEVSSLYQNVNKTDSDLKAWAAKLMAKETSMLEERKVWGEKAVEIDEALRQEFNTTIWREKVGIQRMLSAVAAVRDKIKEAKEFRESSLALHSQLRQQLAETTRSLEEMDQKFGELYSSLATEIARISNSTENLASTEKIKQGEDQVDLEAQETLDKSKDRKPEVEFLEEREKAEAERLRKMRDHLKTIKTESNMAIMKAKELLRRHPNLFERISCVCYDGDKLNGKCIAGSLADESTCDPCPAGSYCLRGEEYPCKTECPGGMVLTGSCPMGSISDVTTCVPSPEGYYSENGVATPCRTTCDSGFELRGTCPVGSSSDTTRCASCPAGFFCTDGVTHECKKTCEAGFVLTGKCSRGMSVDVTMCDPSPVGHYSETGVAIPCKVTCEDGRYLTDTCPTGSTSDTSSCTECPEGSFCTGGKAVPCKKTCENGELLTGTCPAGSTEDVTVCVRCPEGSYCEDGKAIPCKTTCPAGKYLQGRCRKGSTEDTTTCRKCKSGNFCSDGIMAPCKKECPKGYTLEGKCERGSDHDTTTCEGCPEDFYCTSFSKYECKRRCWEGKILRGKCEVGSFEDTTSCDKCPAGEYCKKGVATPCKTTCEDGFLLSGACEEGSAMDTTTCKPCPAGSFCKDNKQEPCKTTCPDGQLLQGFCRAGSASDETQCVPCPAGSFCVDGQAQECVDSCPNGKMLTGSCEEGSSTAITKCEPCPAGSFCRNDEVESCKSSCPPGRFLEGECEEGSSRDETSCSMCPDGSFCADGKEEKCKETCPVGQQLNGECATGSSEDSTTCDVCPAGFFCTDGVATPCKTKSACALGEQFVGECAAGSEEDTTSCDACPPGSYCRGGDARPCRTIIDCDDGHKLDGTCPEGSSMNPVCKPCRAGVFCVGGEETPCRVSCDAGMVLEGFCASGSPSDSTKCVPVGAGFYAVDGAAVPCLTTCEPGKLLEGSCPEGGKEDGMSCTTCPEGSWCENGMAEACTTQCLNGQILQGECPAGSKADTVVCEPCPSGSFCTDDQITPCKTECPDGKFLEGECAPGSVEDTTHCTPCPSGVFCKDGTQTPCTSTCNDGQQLQGFCAAGSTEDAVVCSPCPAGSFCTGGVASPCKTTCDDGEEFKGVCAEGSGSDTTSCEVCPEGFYCQDGLKAECKTSCPVGLEIKGHCSAGSVTDTKSCLSDATPLPLLVDWWKQKSASDQIGQTLTGGAAGSAGAETRLVASAGTSGFIEGRVKMPLNAKWNVQFYAFWPKYDSDGVKDASSGSYPLQGYGEQVEDTITATMNGEEIPMPIPMDKRGKKPQLPGGAYFMKDFEGDELVWRFDFTSQTPDPSARPFIVAGEITILHDDTTDDEGAGFETGNGGLGHSRGGIIRGKIKNAIDGKKLRPGWRGVNDGFSKTGLILKEDARLYLFKKSQLITRIRVTGGRYELKIEEGVYTCVAIMPGLMAFYDANCKVEGRKTMKDIFMSPFVVPGEVRVVLTWGKDRDLDAFMLAPHEQVTDPPCEVNWSNKKCNSGSVKLDKDDKRGYGPETITAHDLRRGRYRYRVSEYKGADDNRASLLASEAQVTVYTATDVKVFQIAKSGAGAGFIRGNSWYVFTIDGKTSKIYPCSEDSCGNGYHDPKGAGRRRLLHHYEADEKM